MDKLDIGLLSNAQVALLVAGLTCGVTDSTMPSAVLYRANEFLKWLKDRE